MPDYQEQWRQYRRRRVEFFLAFAGYVPFCFAVAVVSIGMFQTFIPAFSGSWWYNTGFLARQCVHCGLRKYGN
jgi:hypothetical protein